jgi:hypothetical protein
VYCYCAHLGLRRFRLGLICLVNAKPNILMGTNLVIEILFVIGNCVIFFLNYRRVVQITEVFFFFFYEMELI